MFHPLLTKFTIKMLFYKMAFTKIKATIEGTRYPKQTWLQIVNSHSKATGKQKTKTITKKTKQTILLHIQKWFWITLPKFLSPNLTSLFHSFVLSTQNSILFVLHDSQTKEKKISVQFFSALLKLRVKLSRVATTGSLQATHHITLNKFIPYWIIFLPLMVDIGLINLTPLAAMYSPSKDQSKTLTFKH